MSAGRGGRRAAASRNLAPAGSCAPRGREGSTEGSGELRVCQPLPAWPSAGGSRVVSAEGRGCWGDGGEVRRAGGSGTREKGCVCPAPGAEERCRCRAGRPRSPAAGGCGCGPGVPVSLCPAAGGGARGAPSRAARSGLGGGCRRRRGGRERCRECRGAAVPFSLLGAAPDVSCGTARLSPPAHGSGCGRTGCPSGLAAAFPTPSPVGGPGAGRGSPRLRGGGVRLRGEAGRDPPARPQALCNRRGCHGGSPRSGPTWPRPRDGALPLELRAASPGEESLQPLGGQWGGGSPRVGQRECSAPFPSR